MDVDLPPLSERDIISVIAKNLATSSITLSFELFVTWSLESLTADVVTWLNADSASMTSKVGTLSSPKFVSLAQSAIGPKTCRDFQQMLYAQSLAYTQTPTSHPDYLSITQLEQIAAIAGHSLLLELDRKLTPDHLAKCSKHDLQALFLIAFGAILAVGYTSPPADSPLFPMQEVRIIS
jgi:hypothetical protein